MSNEVRGKNLIKGIFRELAVLRVPVRASIDGVRHRAHISLSGDITRNTCEADRIELIPAVPAFQSILVTFELDDKLLSAHLNPILDSEGQYYLPETLTFSQNRKSKRSPVNDLDPHPLVGELRAPGLRLYGEIKDTNKSHIVFAVKTYQTELVPNQKVQLRVYSSSQQSLETIGTIAYIRETTPGESEIIIATGGGERTEERHRSPRWQLPSSPELTLYWPTESGLKVVVVMTQVALTGFAGQFRGTSSEVPPIGSICRVPSLQIRARLVWRDEVNFGFNLRDNDAMGLSRWAEQIEDWLRSGLNNLPIARQREKIVKLTLRSGYLRGKKAQLFSHSSLDILIPNNPQTRVWLSRYSTTNSSSEVEVHISYLKLSDSSWMIQELGQITKDVSGADTITDSMLNFFLREQDSASLDTHLIAIYDDSSRFNREYWSPKAKRGIGLFSKCVIADLTQLRSLPDCVSVKGGTDFQIIPATISAWRVAWFELLKLYDERILLALGLKYDTFLAPTLRQHLLGSAYLLQRQVALVSRGDKVIGVAVSFGLPTFANLSATANHLWLLLPDLQHARPVLDELFRSHSAPHLVFGATEAVVIPANLSEPLSVEGLSSRSFSVFSIPVLQIPEFLEKNP